MLFMVIEHFKTGSIPAIGERFERQGRLLPDGVTYRASWVEPTGTRCFQIMEAASQGLLQRWTCHWHDLIDFEIVPVLASADFWAIMNRQRPDASVPERREILPP